VVVEVGFVVDTVEVVMLEVVVVVLVVVVPVVVVVVVVALLQDAKSIDVTIRKVIASQITPFFKISSFFHFLEN
jgi:preprotein translocase subunit SecG